MKTLTEEKFQALSNDPSKVVSPSGKWNNPKELIKRGKNNQLYRVQAFAEHAKMFSSSQLELMLKAKQLPKVRESAILKVLRERKVIK